MAVATVQLGMSESALGKADRRGVSSSKELSAEWLRQRYHREGLTTAEIGRLAGFTKTTIQRRMRECGVELRSSGNPAADERLQDEEWFRTMYEDRGHSTAEIAEVCGCAEETAQDWKRKHGVESIGAYKSRGTGENNPNAKEWVTTECHTCGESLNLPIRRIERADVNFCSQACRIQYTINVVMVPGEDHPLYINGEGHDYGPNWPEIREAVIQRDGERCQGCGVSRDEYHMDLHAHHITPFRLFDSRERANRLDNLVALCATCHRQYEGVGVRPVFME